MKYILFLSCMFVSLLTAAEIINKSNCHFFIYNSLSGQLVDNIPSKNQEISLPEGNYNLVCQLNDREQVSISNFSIPSDSEYNPLKIKLNVTKKGVVTATMKGGLGSGFVIDATLKYDKDTNKKIREKSEGSIKS